MTLKSHFFGQHFVKKWRFLLSGEGGNSTKQLLQDAPIILGQFWGPKMFRRTASRNGLKMTLK